MDTGAAGSEEYRVIKPCVLLFAEDKGLDPAGNIQGQPAADRVDHLFPNAVYVVDDLDRHAAAHTLAHQGSPPGKISPISRHPVHGLVGVKEQLAALPRSVGQKADHSAPQPFRSKIAGFNRVLRRIRAGRRQASARLELVQRPQQQPGHNRVVLFGGHLIEPRCHGIGI